MDLPYSEDEHDWTEQQRLEAHRLYILGYRDADVRTGQRIYDRLSKRARRAQARARAAT